MNSLKKGEGVPLLNFEGGPGILLLNFERGPGVPLLNFRWVLGPTFKLWGGFRVPGPGVLVPLLHHAFRLRCKISQMYVALKNSSVTTKFVLAITTGALRFVLRFVLGNHVNFKWAYICSFQKRYCLN